MLRIKYCTNVEISLWIYESALKMKCMINSAILNDGVNFLPSQTNKMCVFFLNALQFTNKIQNLKQG